MKNRHASHSAVWLRRDLRLSDHPALWHAVYSENPLHLIFVIDPETLKDFDPGKKPHAYFFGTLLSLRRELIELGKDLVLLEGPARKVLPEYCQAHDIKTLYFNKDYEPSHRERDLRVAEACEALGITVHLHKDHVIFEERELVNQSGDPYRVFSGYRKAYFNALKDAPPKPLPCVKKQLANVVGPKKGAYEKLWSRLEKLVEEGEAEASGTLPPRGETAAKFRLNQFIKKPLLTYDRDRNVPAIPGTSRLSADLRAGALSPRQIWQAVNDSKVDQSTQEKFLSEMVWRDFFIMIGFNYPHVFKENFKSRYKIRWRNHPKEFKAWCEGRTGFPIVDAGMRELVSTGFMHNRVRMITAMFLVKDLLIDWRWGEEFFRKHLIDGDLAVNNGNWQWCASTGVDSQPYFRIFNPDSQSKKFDPQNHYIRKYVKEFATSHYPQPIVEHRKARERTLMAFRNGA